MQPIGVGETARRILGKAIIAALRTDIQEAAGPLQLCAGQEAGSEPAIHAMRQVFDEPDSEGVLIVAATNVFNTLN